MTIMIYSGVITLRLKKYGDLAVRDDMLSSCLAVFIN